jgi:hypothetical protein
MNTSSFPSKAAQNDALYLLTKQLRVIAQAQHDIYLRHPLSPRDHSEAQTDVYYNFPDTIGSLRDSHIAKAAKFYPQFTAELNSLMDHRADIKATPIVKPVSKASVARAAAEKVILARGDNDTLKSEMLKMAPKLAADFASRIHDIFSKKPDAPSIARFVNRVNNQLVLDTEYLNKYAKQYGEDTATIWYGKMAAKLGAATKVNVVRDQLGSNIKIYGIINGFEVVIRQQIVFGRSCKGNAYHQFPARIYVNDRFVTEAVFAKTFHSKPALKLSPVHPSVNINEVK